MKQDQDVEGRGLAKAPWPIIAFSILVVEVLRSCCIEQGDDNGNRDGEGVVVCLIADIERSGKGGIGDGWGNGSRVLVQGPRRPEI